MTAIPTARAAGRGATTPTSEKDNFTHGDDLADGYHRGPHLLPLGVDLSIAFLGTTPQSKECEGQTPARAAGVKALKAEGIHPVDNSCRLGIGRASVYRVLGAEPRP
jgi:hypothetical protein